MVDMHRPSSQCQKIIYIIYIYYIHMNIYIYILQWYIIYIQCGLPILCLGYLGITRQHVCSFLVPALSIHDRRRKAFEVGPSTGPGGPPLHALGHRNGCIDLYSFVGHGYPVLKSPYPLLLPPVASSPSWCLTSFKHHFGSLFTLYPVAPSAHFCCTPQKVPGAQALFVSGSHLDSQRRTTGEEKLQKIGR